ncbi:MAG: sugar phosphate isomerase/epimerase [Planctomycetes bacterium]|nr:sugar phosphate isomerase/epimerase [Planctomycetota bacterium]MBI3845684.1 sugar phosphate isomerase/epimerase [Planctomycetota bacterium]
MIKAISYWSLNGGLEGTRAIDEAMAEAKAAGFRGIELAVAETGVLTPTTDRKTCESYAALARKHGLALETVASGMSWGCCPTSPHAAVRAKSIQLHRGALERAAWLGAKALLFVPGAIKIPWDATFGPVRYDDAMRWAHEAVDALAGTAEKVGVDLCVENVWNGLFYSPLELAQFVDSFESPRVGVYFDVGNVLGYHQHPPHWIELLTSHIRRVHVKDFKTSVGNLSGFCDLLAGDVPWKETMGALRAIGYDTTIVAEMMPPDPTLLERTSRAMDRILEL